MEGGTTQLQPVFVERSILSNQIDGNTDLIPKYANLGSEPLTLYIGKIFESSEHALQEYSMYARKRGFSVRKQRSEKRETGDCEVYRRDFVCHRSGNGSKKGVSTENNKESCDGANKRQRQYRSCRCNCKAHLSVQLSREGDVLVWQVRSFADDHNHELLEPNEVRYLRAYRHISGYYRQRLLTLEKARVPVPQMLRILETEQGVEVGRLPFNVKDVYNFICSQKSFLRENDAANLVLKCKHLKSLDNEFQYEYQVDGENRLEYIIWCHSTSVRGYQLSGDVVVFDTTYKLNAYDMPVGVWVGVNNHGCSIFFGCCLLRDERQVSFEWAFKVFLKCMGGKAPKTIITDDDPQIGGAIENIFPDTKHALCMWHIAKKFPEVFSHSLKSRFNEWNKAFTKLGKLETEEDFDQGWQAMLDEYDLVSNGHLRRLFFSRSKWAKPYLRSYFFAGMRTTGRSESMNAFIKHTISSQTLLIDFIDQIGKAVGVLDQKGEHKGMQQKATTLTILTQHPIELHASKILTPYAFRKYQQEIVESSSYACYQRDLGFWIVKHAEHDDKWRTVQHLVGEESIKCSCKSFEFKGFLCRHALAVAIRSNWFHTPSQYLLPRWRRESSVPIAAIDESEFARLGRLEIIQSLTTQFVCEAMKSKYRHDLAVHIMHNAISQVTSVESPTQGTYESQSLIGDADSDVGDHYESTTESEKDTSDEYQSLTSYEETVAVENPLLSKPKGRPKTRRFRSWREYMNRPRDIQQGPKHLVGGVISNPRDDTRSKSVSSSRVVRKPRICGVPECRQPGHDRRKCPYLKANCFGTQESIHGSTGGGH